MSNNQLPPGFDDGDIPGFGDDEETMSYSTNDNNTANNQHQQQQQPLQPGRAPPIVPSGHANNNNSTNRFNPYNNHQQLMMNQQQQQPSSSSNNNMNDQEKQMMLLFANSNNNASNNNNNNNNNSAPPIMTDFSQYDNNTNNYVGGGGMMYNNNNYGGGYYPNNNNNQYHHQRGGGGSSSSYFQQPGPGSFKPAAPHRDLATNTVLLKILPAELCNNEEYIQKTMSDFGKVLKLDLKPRTSMAFVHYRTQEEAISAVETLYEDAKQPFGPNARFAYGKNFNYDEDGNIVGDMEFLNRSKQENLQKWNEEKKQQQMMNNGSEGAENNNMRSRKFPERNKDGFMVLEEITDELLDNLSEHDNRQNYFDARGNQFKFRCGKYKLKNEASSIVYLGGVREEVLDDEVDQYIKDSQFEGFVSFARNVHISNGVVFMRFDSNESAKLAIEKIIGVTKGNPFLFGRKVMVDFGKEKERKENHHHNRDNNNTNNESGRRRDRNYHNNENDEHQGGNNNSHNNNSNNEDFDDFGFNSHNNRNNNNSSSFSNNGGMTHGMLGGALVTLPMESIGDDNDDGSGGRKVRSAAEILASLKPKYFTKDRSKHANTISNVLEKKTNNNNNGNTDAAATASSSSKQEDNENASSSAEDANTARLSAAVDSKISALLTFPYFSCGLFPPHTPPNNVAALVLAVDLDEFGDGDDNFVDTSSNKLINELDKIITGNVGSDSNENTNNNNQASSDISKIGLECLPHAISVVTKRLREYYSDDNAKRLHIYYLVATVLFKNVTVQPSIITKALDQFAWLTAVVAEGQDDDDEGCDALDQIQNICSNYKSVFQNVVGSTVNSESMDLLDAVVKTKIEAKKKASDLLAELDALN